MNDYYSISKPQLSLQIETLIFSCLQVCFCIGSQCIASTTLHFDSRSGFISLDVYPIGADRDLFDCRVAFVVDCNFDSRDKLTALHNYLNSVMQNGYSRFTGFQNIRIAS